MGGIVLPTTAADRTHVYHQYTIRVTADCKVDRQQFADALKAEGIIVGMYYPKALNEFPHVQAYGYKKGDFPVAEQLGREVVSLPVHPKLSEADIKLIVATIKKVIA